MTSLYISGYSGGSLERPLKVDLLQIQVVVSNQVKDCHTIHSSHDDKDKFDMP